MCGGGGGYDSVLRYRAAIKIVVKNHLIIIPMLHHVYKIILTITIS